MGRTTYNVGRPGFILGANYDANDGRQISWDDVPASFANSNGDKVIPGGTIMSEIGNGKLAPRSAGIQDATPADYPATCILLATAEENNNVDAISGYGVVLGGVIYTNMLQETDNADFDAWLTELKEAGTGFAFETYSDDRAS